MAKKDEGRASGRPRTIAGAARSRRRREAAAEAANEADTPAAAKPSRSKARAASKAAAKTTPKTVTKTAASRKAVPKRASTEPAAASASGEELDALKTLVAQQAAQLDAARASLATLGNALGATEAAIDAAASERSPLAPPDFPSLPVVEGVTMAAVEAGVRYQGRLDVALFQIQGPNEGQGPAMAGVFTRSRTRAAPVLWCQDLLQQYQPNGARRAGVLVNAGNANAFTGRSGRTVVEDTARAAAVALGASDMPVFVASTGVIGEPLPAERIAAKLSALSDTLAPEAWQDAANAIMTTDTYAKGASAEAEVGGRPVKVVGIAKGSGMIAPDMGTMLVFVFTDAAVDQKLLQRLTAELADRTFNAITVDGDTSTSDSLIVGATGRAGNPTITGARSEGFGPFRDALETVFRDLAQQVVRDGEGATKFVSIHVTGARTTRAARRIGLAVANSPLVKTAWAGEDPNWGRIVMAVGKSGEDADRDALSIRYGPYPVASNGWRAPEYDEETLAEYMKAEALELGIDVGVGPSEATVWTCDLTHRYISINADYRS